MAHILTGYAAIDYAIANGLNLNKYTDPTEEARHGPTEEARHGLSIAEARKIAEEDPGLIWIEEYERDALPSLTISTCRRGHS